MNLLHTEDPALSAFKTAVFYLGTATQLFIILMVFKTAFLASVKPLQFKRSLLASLLSATLSSQIIAIGYYVINLWAAVVHVFGNELLTRTITLLLVFSAVDFVTLSVMKWRTVYTIVGWLVIDVIFVASGFAEMSVYMPVTIGDLNRWIFIR